MTDVIREKCKSLRLAYVADLYEKIPFENPQQYLMDLLQQEIELREIAKGERLIKKAKFMNEKELEDYQWGDHIHFPAATIFISQQISTEIALSPSHLSRGKRM